MNDAYYGVRMSDGSEISHYGVKGMRWGKHLFGFRLSDPTRRNAMTDTGTKAANGQSGGEDIKSHMEKFFAERNARAAANREANAAKQEAARRAAAEAEAEKAKKKASKKSSGSKKASSKAKEEKDEEEEKKEESKTPDLPPELVEKLQDPNAQLTPEEVKMRSENGAAKAKELLAMLPANPTEDDIYDLMKQESDKRGTGYDAFAIGIAIDTAMIKLMSSRISDPNLDDAAVEEARKTRDLHEKMLKDSLRTGKSSI